MLCNKTNYSCYEFDLWHKKIPFAYQDTSLVYCIYYFKMQWKDIKYYLLIPYKRNYDIKDFILLYEFSNKCFNGLPYGSAGTWRKRWVGSQAGWTQDSMELVHFLCWSALLVTQLVDTQTSTKFYTTPSPATLGPEKHCKCYLLYGILWITSVYSHRGRQGDYENKHKLTI